jgi:hypothetical protein
MKEKNSPVIIHLVNRFIKDELNGWKMEITAGAEKAQNSRIG